MTALHLSLCTTYRTLLFPSMGEKVSWHCLIHALQIINSNVLYIICWSLHVWHAEHSTDLYMFICQMVCSNSRLVEMVNEIINRDSSLCLEYYKTTIHHWEFNTRLTVTTIKLKKRYMTDRYNRILNRGYSDPFVF